MNTENENIETGAEEPVLSEALGSAEYDWMEEARVIAAQCWCDKETENIEMDSVLAEAVAKRIAAWMQTAAQENRNTDYYRGLVVRCGEAIGRDAYVQDDGGVCEDVLCAKVPEIVEGWAEEIGTRLKG